jgi:hypothetical protein
MQRMTIGHIRKNVPGIPKEIIDSFEAEIEEYKYGDLIYSNNRPIRKPINGKENILKFVCSGEGEIFESSHFNGYNAYKPIRLLRTGDILGLFSIADGLSRLNIESRPKESWEICAGRRSIIVSETLDTKFKNLIKLTGTKHFAPFHIRQKYNELNNISETLKIINITIPDADTLKNDFSEFSRYVMENSWRDVYQYRTNRNSYNENFYLEIIDQCQNDEKYKKLEASNSNMKHYALPAILRAILEAFDRPYNGELLYSQDTNLNHLCKNDIIRFITDEEYIFSKEKIFIASKCDIKAGEIGYYPIGFHNYNINVELFQKLRDRGQPESDKYEIDKKYASVYTKLQPIMSPKKPVGPSSTVIGELLSIVNSHYGKTFQKFLHEKYPFGVKLNWLHKSTNGSPMPLLEYCWSVT